MTKAATCRPFFARAAALALLIPGIASAQIFMKIADIQGDVTAQDFKDQIAIDSFSWGLSRAVSSGAGGVQQSGVVMGSDIALTKATDKASPGLATALLVGKTQPKVEISFAQQTGNKLQTYISLTLCDVLVTSVATTAANDRPVEALSLNARAFRLVYSDLDPVTGQANAQPPVVWSFETNTADACK
jgi:type VI secretion system secreted protein Hcp